MFLQVDLKILDRQLSRLDMAIHENGLRLIQMNISTTTRNCTAVRPYSWCINVSCRNNLRAIEEATVPPTIVKTSVVTFSCYYEVYYVKEKRFSRDL